MIYFMFAILGLSIGLAIGAHDGRNTTRKIVKALLDRVDLEMEALLALIQASKQPRDETGKFVSKQSLMTQQLIKELNRG